MGETPSSSGRSSSGGPRSASSLVTIAAISAVAGALLVSGLRLAVGLVDSGADDDDRPPIVVNNGSIVFDNGDPDDVFEHWRPWKPDSDGSGRWRSDHDNGKTTNSFFVVIRGVPPATAECAKIQRASEVWIDFTPDGQKPLRFHLWRDHIYQPPVTFKYEPVLEPPSGITSKSGTAPAATGLQPPMVTFGGSGAITLVKIDALECTIPQSDDYKKSLRVFIKPSPSKLPKP